MKRFCLTLAMSLLLLSCARQTAHEPRYNGAFVSGEGDNTSLRLIEGPINRIGKQAAGAPEHEKRLSVLLKGAL